MEKQVKSGHSKVNQLWNFIVHLRWHYQLFILSGGFLLGGFLSDVMNWQMFFLQFASVHLLLFGGATAYNSYWDRDKGPVGGLRHPPRMELWMWFASLLLQALGLMLALPAGNLFVAVYAASMLLFWLYSTPLARWKGHPVKSLLAIGISTGTNSLLMGYLASGGEELSAAIVYAAAGSGLVILSLYPVSQIYQREEDSERGDLTFAIRFGFKGIFHFFEIAFGGGLLLISLSLLNNNFWLAQGFFVTGLAVGLWVRGQLKQLTSESSGYHRVMKIKFGTSLAFVCFLIAALLLKHTTAGFALGIGSLLK